MSSAPEDSASAKRTKPANMKDLPEKALTDDEASEVSGGTTTVPYFRPAIEPCIRPNPNLDPCLRPGGLLGGH